jgi:peptide/nickel transport system permease protein
MDFLKNVLGQLLNPRSRLERLYRSEPQAGTDAAGTEASDRVPPIPRGRLRPRHIVLNFPLMIGTALVAGLFLLAVFGPLWAPKNPYMASAHIVPHYDAQKGEYIRPPLPPSAEYPLGTDRWGNDLLSLMMHGARNTLVACAFITMVRIIVGLILGGMAGWNEGKTFDQVMMALVVVITSVPILISSMILIYALDIRKGLPVFIIALSAIGWAEIAQYIRSEFLVLRRAPYIEGARATGLTGFATAVRHVLPNVLPYLLVITFLEMGAVMMLLGELGFIGVFIGGGSRIPVAADLNDFDTYIPVGIPDVPEWGAILAEGWRFLRSKPFVVLPPALAFFISVVAFNTMGEGLRRLIEQAGFSTGFLLRKRMVLVIAGLTLAALFIMNNTGPAPWYQRAADAFNGDLAYEHIETLTGMAGRASGQPSGDQAAAYIAERFEAYGLEAGRRGTGFVHYLETRVVRPLKQPYLALLDGDGRPLQEFRHQLEFGFVIDGHGGDGDVTAPLTFVGFELEPDQYNWESFKGLDLRDRIVVLMQGNAPPDFATEALIRGARGVLWTTGDGRDDTRSQIQLADSGQRYLVRPNIPIYRIRPSVATALFAPSEVALTDLLLHDETVDQSGPGWFTKDQSAVVRMALHLSEPQEVEVPCVLGYKLGSDYDLADQVVIIFASYDGLGVDPDGTLYPAANHNASSIGLLLEIARLWQQQDLNARRSVVFVAWGGGQLDDSGAREYLNERSNYPSLSTRGMGRDFAPAVIIQPDYVGSGGEELFIHPDSDQRLSSLLRQTAAEAGITVVSEQETVLPYDQLVNSRRTDWLHFTWSDPDIPPDEDTLDRIDPEKLQAIGEAFSLTLTQIVRQTSY